MSPSFSVEPLVAAVDDAGLREQADELGYLFFPGAIDPGSLLRLREAVLRRCGVRGWLAPGRALLDGVAAPGARLGEADPGWVSLQAEVAVLAEFDAVRRNPFVTGVLERLFGAPPATALGDLVRVTAPDGDVATPPHQDGSYVRSAGVWTAWIPLGECPLSLGGLAVLPGSHRGGLLPHAERGADVDPYAVWASTDYRCGDVLLFAGLTVHRAGENRSGDRLRVSADFRYAPGG